MEPKKEACFELLTVKNIDGFAARVRGLLVGKLYSFVEDVGDDIKITAGRMLEEPSSRSGGDGPVSVLNGAAKDEDEQPHAGLNVCDSRGVWGVDTSFQEGGVPDSYVPRFAFIGNSTLIIKHRAAMGARVTWTIVVEG